MTSLLKATLSFVLVGLMAAVYLADQPMNVQAIVVGQDRPIVVSIDCGDERAF